MRDKKIKEEIREKEIILDYRASSAMLLKNILTSGNQYLQKKSFLFVNNHT